MGRGFLSGIFWGGIVGLIALFVSDQTMERQTLSFPRPEAVAVEVPGGSEFNQARPETDPIVPEPDARPGGGDVADVQVPDTPTDTPPEMDTAALEVPVPSTTQDAPDTLGAAPTAVDDVREPSQPADVAVESAPGDGLGQPTAPGAAPDTSTEDVAAPAADPVERAPLIVISPETEAPRDEPSVAIVVPNSEEAPGPQAGDTAPQVAGQVSAPNAPGAPEVESETSLPWLTQHMNSLDQAPDAPATPNLTTEPSLPPAGTQVDGSPTVIATAPATSVDVDAALEEALTAPEVAEDLNTDGGADQGTVGSADSDSALQPAGTLTERNEGGSGQGSLPVVRRLGDSSTLADEEQEDLALLDRGSEEDATSEADTEIASDSDIPALQAFSSAFEAPDNLPMVSVILVHLGSDPLPRGALDALPSHVGFAVDASTPEAPALAASYRDAGREVVMIPALPTGATPQDVETSLAVNFERVPEAVAVMDVTGSSFQSDRAAVAQVVDVLAASGHGMITFPRGLNTAHQQAQRAGVPTGLIFRNLDGNGESQEQIRRTLDRAAFRARQDEAVILVGNTGSTTLSALTEWVLGNRAATVAIAPVSAALGGSS